MTAELTVVGYPFQPTGMAEHARLVMVPHPVLESGLRAAIEEVDGFEFVRSPTRSIRVIEEEFV